MKWKSALLTELSGKIGGAVASRARGDIGYFRKLVTPSNPGTAMQKAAREAIASASTYWRTLLSEANQETWWDMAVGGQTGQTLFNKINQPRIFANNSLRIVAYTGGVTTIPVIEVAPDTLSTSLTTPTSIVIDDSANTLVMSGFNAADEWIGNAPDGFLYVYVSHQQSASRFSRQHPFQMVQCASVGSAVAPTVTVNLATFGFTTQVGKVMYVKLVAQDGTGAVSVSLERRIVIVA